jgi:hypothetical protein
MDDKEKTETVTKPEEHPGDEKLSGVNEDKSTADKNVSNADKAAEDKD